MDESSTASPLPTDSVHAAGESPPVEFPFRAVASPELIDNVTGAYELDWTGEGTDVGGTINLNLALSGTDGPAYLLRVYAAPWVSANPVRFIQALRSHLRDSGLPFPATLVTKHGQGVVWESIQPAVDAYSNAVAPPLSLEERRALSLAIARGVLCVARQLVVGAELGEAAGFSLRHQRAYFGRHANDLAWSLALAQDPEPIQAAFTG